MIGTAYLSNTWHTRVNVPGKALSCSPTVSRLSLTHTHTHTQFVRRHYKNGSSTISSTVVILRIAMSPAVSSRPLTAVAQLRPQVSPYEIYGG